VRRQCRANATDVHFINQCSFNLLIAAAAQNLAGTYPSTGPAGHIYLHYDIDFWGREDNSSLSVGDIFTGHQVASTVNALFGTSGVVAEGPGSLGGVTWVTTGATGGTYTLPIGYDGWMVSGCVQAGTLGTLSSNPTSTYVNLVEAKGSISTYVYDNNQSSGGNWELDSQGNSAAFWKLFSTSNRNAIPTITFDANGATASGNSKLVITFTPVRLPQVTLTAQRALADRMSKLVEEFGALKKGLYDPPQAWQDAQFSNVLSTSQFGLNLLRPTPLSRQAHFETKHQLDSDEGDLVQRSEPKFRVLDSDEEVEDLRKEADQLGYLLLRRKSAVLDPIEPLKKSSLKGTQ